MNDEKIRAEFGSAQFCERLLALKTADPITFARLGSVTLAMLREYERARRPTPPPPPDQAPTAPERRNYDRVTAYLPAAWEGSSGRHDATVSDLSTNGCFLLTSGETKKNEYVKISVCLPNVGWVNLCGVVTNYFAEIGFGVRFVKLTWEGLAHLPAEVLTDLRRPVEVRGD